jgi:hypothetical protein
LELQAEAGGYATLSFTFTGTYSTPIDSSYPASVTLQDVVPPQCELARPVVWRLTRPLSSIRSRSTSATRLCRVRTSTRRDGYKGCRISGRDPKGGFDPEVEENHTFWSQLVGSTLSDFTATIGSVAGNKMLFDAPEDANRRRCLWRPREPA